MWLACPTPGLHQICAQPTGSQSQILLTAALMVSGVIHDVFREKTLTHVPYAAALMKCSIIV